MTQIDDSPSWFGPSLTSLALGTDDDRLEFDRLWLGFMTARVTLGMVLLLLQGALFWLGQSASSVLILISGTYFVATLIARFWLAPRRLGKTFELQWLYTIGADVLVFSVLQFLQGGSINYTPLFALPVLLTAILGTQRLALGTAASITLLLLAHEGWLALRFEGDAAPHFIQAALTGVGSFAIAILAHQLSVRLANQEQRARRNQLAAYIQQQVNDLVIESLSDGILVLDTDSNVHAANPAARHMLLAGEKSLLKTPFQLTTNPGWGPLDRLTQQVFAGQSLPPTEITLQQMGHGARQLRVRTRLTAPQGGSAESLCVMFLQDQREMEARLRTEKLASMGRMSAAMAHEIRNPLAAIVQANALLDEDLHSPQHKQLTTIVQQNAKRLEKIVEEILNIARVQQQVHTTEPVTLDLNDNVKRICEDWAGQTHSQHRLQVNISPTRLEVNFEFEHLRRVLINLLDNARRFASQQAGSIQITTRTALNGQVILSVWSDSPPMETSVERHLFEPFFSSESRSSGLGLYICRELCVGHGAAISYQRSISVTQGNSMQGNEFVVDFLPSQSSPIVTETEKSTFAPWE
jgi:two-component system, NtrC family, sensor histidine kinase PilS